MSVSEILFDNFNQWNYIFAKCLYHSIIGFILITNYISSFSHQSLLVTFLQKSSHTSASDPINGEGHKGKEIDILSSDTFESPIQCRYTIISGLRNVSLVMI